MDESVKAHMLTEFTSNPFTSSVRLRVTPLQPTYDDRKVDEDSFSAGDTDANAHIHTYNTNINEIRLITMDVKHFV